MARRNMMGILSKSEQQIQIPGQSNGYRIIYYAVRDDEEVYLLTIYYKKDDNRTPTNQEIIELVETYCM